MNTFVPVLVKLESLLSITVVFLLFFRRHLLQQGSRVRKLVRVDSLEEMGPGNGVGTTNGNGANAEYQPALQVIILGSGGGPIESNTTAFLVRSTATKWERGSLLAVDAGVHLSAIVDILSSHPPYSAPGSFQDFIVDDEGSQTAPDLAADQPAPVVLKEGPFSGLQLPMKTKEANAGYITRNLVETFLITHPHLDHISGFVVNTAGLGGTRPKRLAGLPNTVEAFKNHIFNNVIWPNLSDENNGAGLVTYMRLVEGGSLAIGDGQGRGYVEVCEGLSVKTWSVSHGHCIEQNHVHTGSRRSSSPATSFDHPTARKKSLSQSQTSLPSPLQQSFRKAGSASPFTSRKPSIATSDHIHRTESFPHASTQAPFCVYDSSAYFIRSLASNHEVLIFGDVEPDSISLSPRNRQVWSDAAPKIAKGLLKGIFIECSYPDSQPEETLFGHLKPWYLIEELKVLAEEVILAKKREQEAEKEKGKKRKRLSNGHASSEVAERGRRRSSRNSSNYHAVSTSSITDGVMSSPPLPTSPSYLSMVEADLLSPSSLPDESSLTVQTQAENPLSGVKIVVIHVKDKLDDGEPAGDVILRELKEYEKEAGLGCEFLIARKGDSVFL